MKFASLLTMESLDDASTTSLSEPEATPAPAPETKEEENLFPESYVQETLTMENLPSLRRGIQSLALSTNEAIMQGALLEQTRELFDESQRNKLIDTAVLAQLNTVRSICLDEREQESMYDEGRLPEGVPRQKYPTMEDINSTIQQVKPVVFKAMDISKLLNQYIKSGFSVVGLRNKLKESMNIMEPAKRLGTASPSQQKPEIAVKLINEGFQKGYEGEELRDYLSSNGYTAPVQTTPLVIATNALRSIRLTKTRAFETGDIKRIADFADVVIEAQKHGIAICQALTSDIDDISSATAHSESLRTEIADRFRETSTVFAGEENNVVWMSHNWPGVTIHPDGTTDVIDVNHLSGHCLISMKNVGEAMYFIQRDLLSRITEVAKQAEELASVTESVKEALIRKVNEDSGVDIATINTLVKSLQTVGHMTFAVFDAVSGVVSLSTGMARAIGIIVEG